MNAFLKKNKTVRENVFFPATKSLCDEKGDPLQWEIKPLTTKEDERFRDSCTREIPIPGKPNMFRHKIDATAYICKLLAASVVYPDLMNAELQDSYEVKTPEDLIKEMIDDPGEFTAFTAFVQNFNGFNVTMQEQVDEAKNS
jgi:hypothetical protein